MAETPGYGTKLQYGELAADPTAATTGWTDVAGMVEVTPPEREVAAIKTTHFTTPSKTHTYRPGNIEPGDGSLSLHWDPTVAANLDAIFGVSKAFRVLFPDGTGRNWVGFINKIGEKVDIEELVTIDIGIKVSGPVTKFTVAA